MKTDVQVINTRHNPRVEEFARDRLSMIVGRFESRLSSIDVHIRDQNSSKGGDDKTCSIVARLSPRGTLHVQATEGDIYGAIHRAVHRLETVVAKTVERSHRGKNVRHGQGGLRHDSERIVSAIQSN